MIDVEKAQVLTHDLSHGLRALIANDARRDEVAFHVSDVLRDFLRILPVIRRAGSGKAIKQSEFDDIMGLMTVHWPYHLRRLSKLKVLIRGPELRPQEGRSRRKR